MALEAAALLLLLAVAAATPRAARAADFTVNPIQIFLSAQAQSAILTIQNTSTEPLRFQLNAFAWAQDTTGQMQLTPTTEVIFFPRLLTLAPNEQRIVRVGASAPPGAAERTYRIFVEELPPSAQQAAPPGQVRVLARMGIPIFVEARAARADLRLGPPVLQAGRVTFELRNAGNKHVVPLDIRLQGLDATGATVWERSQDAWYILAGDRRIYEVPVEREDCVRTRAVAVQVNVGEQTMTERVDVPAPACAP